MERLQAAIEKARAQRQARTTGETPAARPPTREQREVPGSAKWNEIPIPDWNLAHLMRNRVVAAQAGPESGTFDLLRTKILQLMRQNEWRRIAVTSPDKRAGKSTTCCNLIASFARQSDRRSILFDLDMRRPAIASILGHSGEHGFVEVLEDRIPFHKQAVRFGETAAVAMCYKPERNPSELLLRDRTAQILDEIEKAYRPDVMIFDMPPMMVTDDTLAFLRNVDCALLVAGADTTRIEQIDVSEKEIAGQTNVIGVVLNKCQHMNGGYEYEYY